MSKLRMLYSSNAFWSSSGYGVQGRSLLPRLAELPEFGSRGNIAQFAWYGLQGGQHEVDGFHIYPAGADPYGNDIIGAHTKHFGANIVVSLIDVWVMRQTAEQIAPALWLPWLPIDHDPVPQAVLDALQGAYMPLTYSKWGHDLLAKAGVENHYIPHGIETSIFQVLENVDQVRSFKRDYLRCEGHLTVMVAANKGYPDRKFFQGQLRAWKEFAKDKPTAKLYIHTEPTPKFGGLNLIKLATDLGIADRIMFPNQYDYWNGFPAQYLAILYNAADAYMGNSMSEGFGIPLIEAQACGCPVTTTNATAMPELVRWGYALDPLDVIWTPMDAWQAWPDVKAITEALEELHTQWHANGDAWPMAQRLKTSQAIHDEFSWDTIVRDHWSPLIKKLAAAAPPLDARFGKQQPEPEPQSQSQRKPRVKLVTPEDVFGKVAA
jgi:glycosyltransferase involved in cell wall biosynthesis